MNSPIEDDGRGIASGSEARAEKQNVENARPNWSRVQMESEKEKNEKEIRERLFNRIETALLFCIQWQGP